MPQTLHLCRFNFQDQDIRRVGQTTDGGTSLSGISDTIEVDGGGYWRADFTNGRTRERDTGLAWRAITDLLDGGATAVDLLLCERQFQPRAGAVHIPELAILSDGSAFVDPQSAYTAAPAPLRATTLTITGSAYAQPIDAGVLFAVNHPTWGWRTYRIVALDGITATIRPPLREAITAATPADFDYPRCRMRLAQATGNPTNIGRFTSCALSFVEDMRRPA